MSQSQTLHIRSPVSLQTRLISISTVTIAATLIIANSVLTQLFERQVTAQFQSTLRITLDQLANGLSVDSTTRELTVREPQGDSRWTQPYSGTYWQINASGKVMPGGMQRSRSLWDFTLTLPRDTLADGAVHTHWMSGPNQQRIMALERIVILEHEHGNLQARLIAAADTRQLHEAIDEFNHTVVLYLLVLAAVLLVILVIQLTVGLSPLRALNQALTHLRNGNTQHLEGVFPSEIRPLAENFNTILSEHRRYIERARTLAGNLAHAVRTPLAVMVNAAADASVPPESLRETIKTHGALAQTQIDWHLKRSRMGTSAVSYGHPVAVRLVVDGIVSVMQRAYADKGLEFRVLIPADGLYFKGESQDLQEILGNLIDNASKWARHHVSVSYTKAPDGVAIIIEDDGPGVPPEQHADILKRGVRMDEVAPGSGLGLAIVSELLTLYGGRIAFATAESGGLSVRLWLPLEIR